MESLALPITAETLTTAAKMALGFLFTLFVGARFLPGIERTGYPQPDGTRKRYSLTGMTLFFLAHIVLVVSVLGFGVSLTPIARHFWPLLVVALASRCPADAAHGGGSAPSGFDRAQPDIALRRCARARQTAGDRMRRGGDKPAIPQRDELLSEHQG